MEEILGMESLSTAMAIFAGATVLTIVLVVAWDIAQRSKKSVHTLGNEMSNARLTVAEWEGDEGAVYVDGELWRAISKDALSPGDKVTVAKVDGLVLKVKKKQTK